MPGAVEYTKTLTSFSGADLVVTFGKTVIGELQQITWAISREKVPVYTMGSPDPRSFSRGKRGISGTLIFAVFDKDALIEALVKDQSNWQQIAPPVMFTAAGNTSQLIKRGSDLYNALEMSEWNRMANETAERYAQNPPTEGSDLRQYRQINVPPGFDIIKPENIIYADMIPPFDIMMTFANEYGQAAFQKIYGVELLNEGSGVNVDTIVMERQFTFIARRISPIISGVYSGDGTLDPLKTYVK